MSSKEKDKKITIPKKKKITKQVKTKSKDSSPEKVNNNNSEPKESSQSNNSEQIKSPNEVNNKKKLENFMDKVNESSRGRKKIKKSSSQDANSANANDSPEASEEPSKEKSSPIEPQDDLQEIVNNLLMKMKLAESSDLEANANLLPAFAKLELIDKEISQAMKNLQVQKLFVELEGLKILEK